MAALEAIAGEAPTAGGEPALDLPTLARLLYFSAGITKYIEYPLPWARIPFRAAACTGALYLAAYALGFGATGLTFIDDAVTDFFLPHAQGKSVMFLITLGKKRQRP